MGTASALIHARSDAGGPSASVVTVGPDATVRDAARRMNEHRIGCLVVTNADGRIAGIFTERDVLSRIVAEGKDPGTVRVGDVMTKDVLVCRPDTTTDELRALMREKRIRHVPVVDPDGELVGIVSIGDLNIAEARVMTETIRYLETYMTRM